MPTAARARKVKQDERPWEVVDSTGEDTAMRRSWFKSTAEDVARELNNGTRRYRIVARFEVKK